jgi:hypothetical protein
MDASIGRVALVQLDTRFCTHPREWRASLPGLRAAWFWWSGVRLNSRWAEKQGHDHILFCVKRGCACGGRKASWCKIKAVAAVLRELRYDTVLFVDSDAYLPHPTVSLPSMLQRYVWPGEWRSSRGAPLPALFFACNHPFVNGWPSRPRENTSLPPSLEEQLVRRGPPNSGVFVARNTPEALEALRAWWTARPDAAWAPTRRAWPWHTQWQEQGALWDLFLSNSSGFSRVARVLSAMGASIHPLRWASCLSGMGPPMGGGGYEVVAGSASTFASSRTPAALASPRRAGAFASPHLRHLEHHSWKWASTRAATMTTDVEGPPAARESAPSTRPRAAARVVRSEVWGETADRERRASRSFGVTPPLTVNRQCRTRLIEFKAAASDCAVFDAGGPETMTPPAGHDSSEFGDRGGRGDARRDGGRMLTRGSCVDGLLAGLPPCRRALRNAVCAVEISD